MMQVAKSAMPAGTGEVAAQILPMPRIVPHQFPRLPPIKGEAMYGTSVYRNGPEGKRIYMIFGEFNSEEIAVIERMTQIYKADLTEQAKKLMTELI